MDLLIEVLLLVIGAYEIYATRNSLINLKKNGTKNTSKFILLALYFSFALGIVFIIFGLAMIFKWI